MNAIPTCLPPDRTTKKPAFAIPAGSCDCHAHICGPLAAYPCIPERLYTPTECSMSDYERTLAVLGVSRAVLVQPSFYGDDNRAVLDAMKAATIPVRCIAVIPENASDVELERLHAAGVRGARFNIVDIQTAKGVLPIERIRRLAERIAPFGWHIELLMHADEFPDLDRTLGTLPVDVVLAHLGYVKTVKGPETAGFRALLRLLAEGRAWVKLTGPYRISATTMPHGDTDVFARALAETAIDRLVWGTDWPHVMARWSLPMPNDGDLTDLLVRWIPDETKRRRVLVDNPTRLYGFTEVT
jgi:predicted TIM-barrel fold metal-dependent hydrolase